MSTAATHQLQSLARITPLIEQARARSARLGRPILASLTAHLGPAPDYDPGQVIEQPDSFVWQQPQRGLALAAAGHATRLIASGESRFFDIQTQLQRLLDEAVSLQDSGAALRPAPLCFAGFAFDPMQADDVAWFGFPEALAILPRLLIARSGAHLFFTANLMVDAETDPALGHDDLRDELERLLTPSPANVADRSARLLDAGPEARAYWNDSVTALVERISAGDAEKVVLARRVQVESDGPFNPRAALSRLRERYRECTVFALRSGEDACFLGATPEMLVALSGRHVRADCLAGSAARGASDAEDAAIGKALLADDKERREHAIVARSLREALAPLCADVRSPHGPDLRRFANVQHLHTPIEATTDGPRHVLELVQRLHPSAATAGLPREASLGLVRDHEPFSRGWYAGPIGWIDAEGGGEFAVALRSALLRDDVASLYAGCGIVPGSDPDREYAESRLKLNAMLWALNAKSPLPEGEGRVRGERPID
ncbi:MAG TPA: isochorismate synthase [Dehalococcoidia bacterium]|nr:isochorismate synthase [Dehalococcoidia bacterium]